MFRPLFNAALVLLEYEPSETQKSNLEKAWRWTFKRFMMIDTKISNSLINEMINSVLAEECKLQWEDRKNYRELKQKKRPQKKLNLLRGVPNKWC